MLLFVTDKRYIGSLGWNIISSWTQLPAQVTIRYSGSACLRIQGAVNGYWAGKTPPVFWEKKKKNGIGKLDI